jgi:pilus assembly protein CpaE
MFSPAPGDHSIAEASGAVAAPSREPSAVDPASHLSRLRELEAENHALRRQLAGQDAVAAGVGVGREPVRKGMLVVIASAKGGVGKSVIAAHLAVGLARFYLRETVLVDANLRFGDQAVLLNLKTPRCLEHLAQLTTVDAAVARDLLTPHGSGLRVLVRPHDLVAAETVDPGIVVALVRAYQAISDYVVVDAPTGLEELSLQLCEAADKILVVATPEMTTAAQTIRFLEMAGILGHAQKTSVVLNRANAGIDQRAMTASLGIPVTNSVVSAGQVVLHATNDGVALYDRDPAARQQITKDLRQLVATVAGEPLPMRVYADDIGDGSSRSEPQPKKGPAFRFASGAARVVLRR